MSDISSAPEPRLSSSHGQRSLPQSRLPAWAIIFATGLAVATITILWRHVGIQASDDADYIRAGLGWLDHFPYVGTTHWSLRHTVVVPIAAAVAAFGFSEASVVLPSVLYFAGFLCVNAIFAARHLGARPALVSTLLMVLMPGSVVLATYVTADIAELFFISATFWMYIEAVANPKERTSLILCGALAGLGFLTRETSIAFPIFLGLMFIFRPQIPRFSYMVIAAGFLAIVGLEWIYLWGMTGDPLYRFQIDGHHDVINRTAEASYAVGRKRALDGEGAIAIGPWWINPFLNLFISQKYGLLYWAAVPATLHVFSVRRNLRPDSPIVLGLIFAGVWFFFIAFNPKLYFVPRYLLVCTSLMSLTVGVWFTHLWENGKRRLMVCGSAALFTASLLGLLVENTNPCFSERILAAYLASHPSQKIRTDSNTQRRVQLFLLLKGVDPSTVVAGPIASGDMVFYNPNAISRCAATARCKTGSSEFDGRNTWKVIEQWEPPQSSARTLLAHLGVDHLLPRDIAQKVLHPIEPIELYEVR